MIEVIKLKSINDDKLRKKKFLSLYLNYADRYLPLHQKRNLNICDIFTITISESGEVIFKSPIVEELQDVKFKMIVAFNQIEIDRPKAVGSKQYQEFEYKIKHVQEVITWFVDLLQDDILPAIKEKFGGQAMFSNNRTKLEINNYMMSILQELL